MGNYLILSKGVIILVHTSKLYWTQMTHQDWKMYLVFTDEAIVYISSPNNSFDEVQQWTQDKFPKHELIFDDLFAEQYIKEITDYLNGKRNTFKIPTYLSGTNFQLAVWDALKKIPYGEIHTYTDVAEAISNPKAVRAVGAAIGANPLLMIVPCHRVIAKSGALTGFRAGLDVKERLIELEKST